jgi:extradiol dioxygenase family protein
MFRRLSTVAKRSLGSSAGGIAPFHHAFPVHDLELARKFYGELLGFEEGRSSKAWIDYNCFGHQIVAHLVGNDYKAPEFYNPVGKSFWII